MPQWPETLPASPLASKYEETAPDNILRTQMEQGPAKLRRRATGGVAQLEAGYLMTAAQVAALEEFRRDQIAGGALAFDFPHPRTGTAVSCRLRKSPVITARGNGHYHVRLSLEVLP